MRDGPGSAILLDTHTLLWLLSTPDTVAAAARGEPLLAAWPDVLAAMAITELAIEAADAIMAGRLPWERRDPFDRMIVAQAARRGLTIATRDAHILGAALTPTLRV